MPNTHQAHASRILLVTGMSGAGRSTALKILEDSGYDAIDNLPLQFLLPLIEQICKDGRTNSLAIGIDTRSFGFGLNALGEILQNLSANPAFFSRLLYLECDDEALLRRFTETRRRHPFEEISLSDAIARERRLIDPLKDMADLVIDTTQLSIPDFGQMVRRHFSLENSLSLLIHILSFAYRHGLPREADMVFDARFLSNPYYEKPLRTLTGKDEQVENFLTEDSNWKAVYAAIQSIIQQSLKGFRLRGRSYLTIACGCTGGQHRSVFLAEHLYRWLTLEGENVIIDHRDLPVKSGEGEQKT